VSIIRNKRTSNFTTIPNALVNDTRLRWNDLGLLVYLLSKPDTWSVRVDVLVKERSIGRDAVYGILKRLRDAGYAKLIRFADGTTEWSIFDKPNTEKCTNNIPDQENPDQENPDQENPDRDFPHVLVNTDIKKRLINSNKDSNKRQTTLNEFLINCKETNQPAIPEDDPIFDYAEKVGIPPEYLRLGWIQFKSLQDSKKRQSDWRAVFRNYVKRGFLRVWFIDNNGNYALTTTGKQLAREVS